ncbi:hypothetical protein JYT83_01370 [bacterium AH-315-F18]|nr:hypothetical protein [bacterium AH-315-F18]
MNTDGPTVDEIAWVAIRFLGIWFLIQAIIVAVGVIPTYLELAPVTESLPDETASRMLTARILSTSIYFGVYCVISIYLIRFGALVHKVITNMAGAKLANR